MTIDQTIVLKLGSSVLRNAASYAVAATFIGDCTRKQLRVIAVVSAMLGETDRLLACCQTVGENANPHDVARFVASGEVQSAHLLCLAAQANGIAASVTMPEEIELIASGPAHDANPVSLSRAKVTAHLNNHQLLVLPGFFGVDDLGRTVLFGRGGSDDSALFVAYHVGAKCTLIKDVDGIFEYDPASQKPPPRRYSNIAYDDALEIARVMVQPKAVEFAREKSMQFSIQAIEQSAGGTVVGSAPSVLAKDDTSERIISGHH